MQQTKYYSNVIVMSVSGRKKNKQIKTHETDTAWHEAYYSREYECTAV